MSISPRRPKRVTRDLEYRALWSIHSVSARGCLASPRGAPPEAA